MPPSGTDREGREREGLAREGRDVVNDARALDREDRDDHTTRDGAPLRVSDLHRKHLRGSCLSDDTIRLAGLYTETDPARIAALLHYDRWSKARGAAIVFPVFLPPSGTSDATTPVLHRLRPDKGAVSKKTGKVRKYEQPKAEATGVGAVVYYPPRTLRSRLQSDSPIVFTEGEKKALFADQASSYAVVAGAGVDCFHDAAHARETGEWRLHPWIAEHLRIDGRRCLLAFDGDRHTNPDVDRAMRRLAGMLKAAGALDVRAVVMPEPAHSGSSAEAATQNAKQKGIDDLGADAFERARANGASEEDAFDTAHRMFAALLERTEPVDALEPKEAWLLVRDLVPLQKAPLVGALRWPEEYQLRRDLTLWHAPNPEEMPKLVMPGIVMPARILLDLYTGEERTEIVFRRGGRWRTAIVDRVELGDRRAAVSALRRIGVAIDSNNAAAVIGFLTAFEALNEERLPRTQCVSECGWHGEGDALTFCAPDPVTTSSSKSTASTTTELVFDRRAGLDSAVRGLTTAGTEAAQRDLFRHVVRTSDAATVALCAALASPLLELVGAAGFAVHLQGDSSKGKSTMLKIAASVFGDPSSDAWLASWDSTSVGLEVRAAILRHLPLCLDEAGVVDPAIRSRAVMTITNGVGRTRGEKTGGLRHTRQWRLVVLSTGESELVPSAAGASGQRVRVLNVIVDGFGELGATGVDAIRDTAVENFGHFGRWWVQRLRDADHGKLRAAWKAAAEYLRTKADANSQAGRQALSWALLFVVEGMLRDALEMERPATGCVERYYASDDAGSANANRALHELARDVLEDWVRSRPGLFPTLKLNASNAWVTPGDFARREMLGVLRPGRGAEFWLNRDAVRDALAKKGLDETALRSMAEHGHLVRDGKNLASKRRFDCSFGRWFVIPAKSLNFEEGPDADEFDASTE